MTTELNTRYPPVDSKPHITKGRNGSWIVLTTLAPAEAAHACQGWLSGLADNAAWRRVVSGQDRRGLNAYCKALRSLP